MVNLNDERNRLWDEIHSAESPTYHFREMLIHSLLPVNGEGKRALDVGCGTGRHVCQLLSRGFSVDAIDPSSYAVEVTREKAQKISSQCTVAVCGIEEYKSEGGYDFILASEVLEHVKDDKLAIKQISSHLSVGGSTLVTVPHDMKLWSASDEASGHLRRYSKHELKEKLEKAGLEIATLNCYGFPFLQLLFRVRKFITRGEGIKKEKELQKRIVGKKAGHFFFEIFNRIALIDRLNLFPDKGVGLITLAEKKR